MSVYRVRWSEGDDKIVVADSFAAAQQRFIDWCRQDDAVGVARGNAPDTTAYQALEWIDGIDKLSDESPLLPGCLVAEQADMLAPHVSVGTADSVIGILRRAISDLTTARNAWRTVLHPLLGAAYHFDQDLDVLTQTLQKVVSMLEGSMPPPVAVPAGQQDGDAERVGKKPTNLCTCRLADRYDHEPCGRDGPEAWIQIKELERETKTLRDQMEMVGVERAKWMAEVATLKQEKAALVRALARCQIVAEGNEPDGDAPLSIAEEAVRGLRARHHARLVAIRISLIACSHELAVAAERLHQNRCCRCGAPVRLDCRDGCTKGACAYRTNDPVENKKLTVFQQAGELLQDVR